MKVSPQQQGQLPRQQACFNLYRHTHRHTHTQTDRPDQTRPDQTILSTYYTYLNIFNSKQRSKSRKTNTFSIPMHEKWPQRKVTLKTREMHQIRASKDVENPVMYSPGSLMVPAITVLPPVFDMTFKIFNSNIHESKTRALKLVLLSN